MHLSRYLVWFLLLFSSFSFAVTQQNRNVIPDTYTVEWKTDQFHIWLPTGYRIEEAENGAYSAAHLKGTRREDGISEFINIKTAYSPAKLFEQKIKDYMKKAKAAGTKPELIPCATECKILLVQQRGNSKEFGPIIYYRLTSQLPEIAIQIVLVASTDNDNAKSNLLKYEEQIRSSIQLPEFKIGKSTYKGRFQNGRFTGGEGTIYRDDGTLYEGQVDAKRRPSGKGKLTFKNGDYLSGEFKNGILVQGKGKIALDDGSRYTGQVNNKQVPHGEGKKTYPDSRFLQGKFDNGVFQGGYGKILFKDNPKYTSYTGPLDKQLKPTSESGFEFTSAEKHRLANSGTQDSNSRDKFKSSTKYRQLTYEEQIYGCRVVIGDRIVCAQIKKQT